MLSDKKNSLWLSVQYIFSLLFSLITLKLNISHYGTELFGIWILIISVWGLSGLFDFGFGTSVLKYVAQFKDDETEVSKILSTSFVVFFLIGAVIFFVGNTAAYFIYINNPEIVSHNSQNEFALISFLLGFAFIQQYFAFFFKAIIEGLNIFVFTSKMIILRSVLNLTGVLLITYFGMDILFLAILNVFETLFLLISYFLYFAFRIKGYKISLKFFDKGEIKRIISFSLSVQLMTIFNALIDPIIKFIIGNYYNVGTVSIYEIARRFAVSISGLFFNAFRIILPKASSLKTDVEIIDFLKNEISKFSRLGIVYSGVMFGVFSLFFVILITVVFKFEEAVLIFLILALPESINNFGYSLYNFLLGIGKTRILVLIQLNNLIFVIVSMLIGFIVFQNIFGLMGYFLSVLIGNVLMILYIHKEWKVYSIKQLIDSKAYKLPMLILLMFMSAVFIYFNLFPNYYIISCLSVLSFLLFVTDIKDIFNQLIKPILKGRFSV